jgi:hypothetical protein
MITSMNPTADDHVAITNLLARYCLTLDLEDVEAKAATMRRSVYTDQLRRTEGGWRIAKRRCRVIVADGLSDRPDD